MVIPTRPGKRERKGYVSRKDRGHNRINVRQRLKYRLHITIIYLSYSHKLLSCSHCITSYSPIIGIGLAVAEALAREGANILLNGSSVVSESLLHDIGSIGVRVEYFRADMSVPSQIEDMMNFAANKFGSIDILVNNAGDLL